MTNCECGIRVQYLCASCGRCETCCDFFAPEGCCEFSDQFNDLEEPGGEEVDEP